MQLIDTDRFNLTGSGISFQLLVLIVTLSWTIALAGIGAWVYKGNQSNDSELIELLSDSNPKKIHPALNLSQPIEQQLRLFPTDKVKIYAPSSAIEKVRFGGEWEPFTPNREYIVLGYPGQPVTPEFIGNGVIKMEISILHDRDKQRDLRSISSNYAPRL